MAKKQRNELVAGLFVLVCVAALVGILVWLSGVQVGERVAYVAAPLSAGDTGIIAGSEVKIGPTRIGKVTAVEPSEDWTEFLYRVQLEADVDLRSDALVESAIPTLGGAGTLVVLQRGSPDAPAADREHPIPLHVGPNPLVRDIQRQLGFGDQERTEFQQTLHNINVLSTNLADVSASLAGELNAGADGTLLAETKATLGDLRQVAAGLREESARLFAQLDPANPASAMGKIHASLDDVNAVTSQAAGMIATVRPDVERAVGNVARTTDRVDAMTAAEVPALLASLQTSSEDLVSIMHDLRGVSAGARDIMTVNRENIDEIIANMTRVSLELKAAAREIRAEPWRLMGKPDVEDVRTANIREAANAFAASATELDAAIQRLSAMADTQSGPLPADDPQLLQVRQRIRDSFGRFLQAEEALYSELAP